MQCIINNESIMPDPYNGVPIRNTVEYFRDDQSIDWGTFAHFNGVRNRGYVHVDRYEAGQHWGKFGTLI